MGTHFEDNINYILFNTFWKLIAEAEKIGLVEKKWKLRTQANKIVLKEIRTHNNVFGYPVTILVEYSDNKGELETFMEHGEIFQKLPYLRISKH